MNSKNTLQVIIL